MKLRTLCLVVTAASALLLSCATNSHPATVNGKLQNGEVAFQVLAKPVASITAKPFFAVSALNGFLESLDLLDLPLETKREILTRVFAKVSYASEDGAVGELRLGGYFKNGADLVLRLAVATPGPQGQPPRADKILIVQSNALLEKPDSEGNRAINRRFGAFMDIDSNVSDVYLTFADGRLVKMQNVFNQEFDDIFQKNKSDPLNLVNMSDSYLKDERLENDALVPQMLEAAYHSPKADDSIKIVSRLNLSLYWMAQNDLAKAESVLREVQADTSSKRKEFSSIIDRDAVQMIELQKGLLSTSN